MKQRWHSQDPIEFHGRFNRKQKKTGCARAGVWPVNFNRSEVKTNVTQDQASGPDDTGDRHIDGQIFINNLLHNVYKSASDMHNVLQTCLWR